MDGFQAYGAGKAGETFDPLTFFTQPQTLVRVLCWGFYFEDYYFFSDYLLFFPTDPIYVVFLLLHIFSMVVLGCVVNEGYVNRPDEVEEFCVFNRNQSACSLAVGTGTLCFLCSAALLVLDVYFPQISAVKDRKKAVMADIAVSALWSLLWFVGFCFLTNQWQVSKEEDNPLNEGVDAARATIVFSFFSIFTWALQSLLAVHRFKLGSDSVTFNQDYQDPEQQAPPPEEAVID